MIRRSKKESSQILDHLQIDTDSISVYSVNHFGDLTKKHPWISVDLRGLRRNCCELFIRLDDDGESAVLPSLWWNIYGYPLIRTRIGSQNHWIGRDRQRTDGDSLGEWIEEHLWRRRCLISNKLLQNRKTKLPIW